MEALCQLSYGPRFVIERPKLTPLFPADQLGVETADGLAYTVPTMTVTLEKLPQSRVRLRVEVPATEVRPHLERAARVLSKERPPKGFRPGSAPLPVMRSTLGDAAVLERGMKELVQQTFVEALLERDDVEAIGSPEVSVETASFDGPVVYTAAIAVLPKVTLGDYRHLTAARNAVEVTSADVDRELDVLQKMRASYVTVPRAAQNGDRVEVDFVGSVDTVPLEPGKQTKQPLLRGETALVPGFEEQLVGMNEGETKTFSVRFPDQHHQAHLQGKTVDFTVTMGTIQQRFLPKLDDAFARGLGTFAGLADLKAKLADNLREDKEQREQERLQGVLLDAVAAAATFEAFPPVLIERELDRMVAELHEGVADMGLTVDAYLAQIKKTPADVREGLREQAERRVRAGLVLRALARAERIAVSDAEVEAEVSDVLRHFGGVPEEAAKRFDLDELRSLAAGTVRNRKVFARLEEIAAKNG